MRSQFACCHSMRGLSKRLLISMGVLCFSSLVFTEKIHAQNVTNAQEVNLIVKGRVSDDEGKPLQGVSVQLKGSSAGTVTNSNGDYQLTIQSNKGSVLVFTYVGMLTREVAVNGKGLVNVSLSSTASQQQEVVVVGYGTQKKQAVTGAVSSAKLKTYENVAVNNIMERVKGTLPGLEVGAINRAGQEATLRMRGQNSINAGTSPLIVVDGAIFRGTINDIAPADIESLTILKDASAAAVYGSRSANGVILIETKRGSGINGKPKFNVNLNTGVSSELEPLKVYDAQGYLQRLVDMNLTKGIPTSIDTAYKLLQNKELANYMATPDHLPTVSSDPYSLFRQTGKLLNATVSVSNKTDKTEYYISGNMVKQTGVILNDEYNHYSTRMRISSDMTNWLRVGANVNYSYKENPGITIADYNSVSRVNWFSPWANLMRADGTYDPAPQDNLGSFHSPYWQTPSSKIDRRNSLNGILTATVKIPWVKGLSYNLTNSWTQNWNESGSFYGLYSDIGSAAKGSGDMYYSRSTTVLLDHLLKYNKSFGDHNVDVTLLYSTENYKLLSEHMHGENFTDVSLGLYGLKKAQKYVIPDDATNGGSQTSAVGEMARVTYNYQNKYFVTGTIRQDGYSAFSENNKYATFPAVGVSWQLTKEKFMENVKPVNNLSLRASYGTNGNQSISPYSTLARISNGYYVYNDGSNNAYTQQTQYISTLGNSNLKWEEVHGVNLGLDFSVLKNRISGSVDWYSKYTKNLIFAMPIPSTSGYTSINTNIGKVANKGVEISLSTLNMEKGNFSWRSDVAFSRNRNTLVRANKPLDSLTGKEPDQPNSGDGGLFIGKPINTIYTYEVTGMWQQADKDNSSILVMKNMQPGMYKLLDVNGDSLMTPDKDKVFIGYRDPSFRWSFTNTFQYKELSLMVYLYSMWGGNGYFLSTNTPYNDSYAQNTAMNHTVYDYWTPSNTNATFPRLDYKNLSGPKGNIYFDRSFIKLQKISLTYDMAKYVKRYGIGGMSLSVSADNLFTYAPHWIGLDPETESGLTDSSIPSIRTVMVGLNVNF